jgi:RNA polymerase sigma-70 factor (ECF subfamily)
VYPDWEAIYADNVGRIYRLMFAKVGNRPDAEDLTSQVFMAALGPLRAGAEMGRVRAVQTATPRRPRRTLAAHAGPPGHRDRRRHHGPRRPGARRRG